MLEIDFVNLCDEAYKFFVTNELVVFFIKLSYLL